MTMVNSDLKGLNTHFIPNNSDFHNLHKPRHNAGPTLDQCVHVCGGLTHQTLHINPMLNQC